MNEKQTIMCNVVGYYHFTSKDKKNTYYVLQALRTESTESLGDIDKRSSLKDIFIDREIYVKLVRNEIEIGDSVNVEISVNTQTDKAYYKVVI